MTVDIAAAGTNGTSGADVTLLTEPRLAPTGLFNARQGDVVLALARRRPGLHQAGAARTVRLVCYRGMAGGPDPQGDLTIIVSRSPFAARYVGHSHANANGARPMAGAGVGPDSDGMTRDVSAWGSTGAQAEQSLRQKLASRVPPNAGGIDPETRLSELAEIWHQRISSEGRLAPRTLRRYRVVIDWYVVPGFGGVQIREATVPRLDRYLKGVAIEVGSQTAQLAKTVLSGMLGLAVRHGAIDANPVPCNGRTSTSTYARRPWSSEAPSSGPRASLSFRIGPRPPDRAGC